MSKHPPPAPTLEESVRCPLLDHDTEAWIRCCTSRFLPFARHIAGDDATAHDALQESWIIVLQKLWQYRGDPRSDPRACSWVAAIVRHEVRHCLTAERRDRPSDAAETQRVALDPRHPDIASPEAALYSRELTRVLLEAIDELPPTFRDVVRLRDVEDCPPDEVARRLHLSRGHVAVRLHRAHRLLRPIVERRLFGDPSTSQPDPKKIEKSEKNPEKL